MPADSVYVCSGCAHESVKWHGRCPGCEEWNTMIEEARRSVPRSRTKAAHSGRSEALRPIPLRDVATPAVARLSTGIGELDRVLGGGLVPGSLVLLAGEPGIGKSTITADALGRLSTAGSSVLYVSGEESAAQVRLRAERLGEGALAVPIITGTDLDEVASAIERERPAVCVVDSVQTLCSFGLGGVPGSVGQVREVAGRMMGLAKGLGVAIILVGHVTKDGTIAGPRVLEHLVDCVLQFEGERERTSRALRALKNRFGSTNEVGVFEMAERGLIEVEDASSHFVSNAGRAAGSAIICAMEGSRPLLVEAQALVTRSELPSPRRIANGVDRNRLALILAVLQRHCGMALGSCDVFVSIAGGVRIEEPGADLGLALALVSASRGVVPVAASPGLPLAAFGEIGLTGELRQVAHPDRRLAEATRFGLVPAIHPGAARTVSAALELAFREAASQGGRRAAA